MSDFDWTFFLPETEDENDEDEDAYTGYTFAPDRYEDE